MFPGLRQVCLFLLVIAFSAQGVAQVTASAGISATIVTPIGINKEVDLDFGNIAPGTNPGTVMLKPDGSRVISGGASLPSVTGTVSAATFEITGAPGYTYSITLPGEAVTLSNGTENMTVAQFTSQPAGNGMLGPSGSDEVAVGATISVGASQPLGDYLSNSPFPVMVNYN